MKMTKKKRRLAALKGWRSRHRTGAVSRKRRRNVSKRKTLKRVGAALKKWIRGNPPLKVRGIPVYSAEVKPEIDYEGTATGRFNVIYYNQAGQWIGAKTVRRRSDANALRREAEQRISNPHRVKGRKVKGGRAVTLKNMKSVTITRKSNGVVSVRGVQLKGRKR
jgi:hypothetical protein